MKRCQPSASEFAERPQLRLQEAIRDGTHRVGESSVAQALSVRRRAIVRRRVVVNQLVWHTERKASVTLH